jgi:quinol-cytochrome oxidoreductase complex cytochrome b subunit
MTTQTLTILIAGLFCAAIIGLGIWGTLRNQRNNPATAAATPAKPLTIMRIAWGVCLGNLIAAAIIGIILSGINWHGVFN